MTPAEPKERGRPSVYTPDIAAEICARLANGETLRAICRDEGMPAESTVRNWALDEKSPFFAQYEKARLVGYLGMFDEIKEIADTTQEGVKVVEKLTGTEVTRADMIEHRRLRVDARKWMLAKALPKVFGDRITADVNATIEDKTESPLEIARGLAFLLQVGRRETPQPEAPVKH